MKKTLVLFAALSALASSIAQTTARPPIEVTQDGSITRARLSGSLEPRQAIGCIDLSEVRPSFTAPDLFAAVTSCAKDARFDDAASVFFLAGMTLRFDMERVRDRSVAQARQILVGRTFAGLTKEQLEGSQAALSRVQSDPLKIAQLCQAAEKSGPPDYFPAYLVLHGIAAFGKEDPFKDALVPGFEGAAKWTELRDKYLHCPKT